MAAKQEKGVEAFDAFAEAYKDQYSQAVHRLDRDRQPLRKFPVPPGAD